VVCEPDRATDRLAYSVIGAAIEVHRALGPGFLEAAYEAALDVELGHRSIRFERQKVIPVSYRDRTIALHRLDFLVDERLIVELKAVEFLVPIHFAQMVSYLAATGLSLGLLINFNVGKLKHGIHRIVRS